MMAVAEYDRRVMMLFKSGNATPALWAELVEAVGCAFNHDVAKLQTIHKAIGFSGSDEHDAPLPLAVRAAMDAATSDGERMQVLARHQDAKWSKVRRAQDRRWGVTLRKLNINGGNRHAARA